MFEPNGIVLCRIAAAALIALSVPAQAKDASAPANPEHDLHRLGMELEWIALKPMAEQGPMLRNVQQSLAAAVKAGVAKEKQAAAHLLSGGVHYQLGDYRGAQQAFDQAQKRADKTPYADDAAFAEIIAMEASGEDADAAEAWTKWATRYPESPLLPEAWLAQSWNAIRRGSFPHAEQFLGKVREQASWMHADARVVLAEATLAYLDGRAAEALDHLNRGAEDAPALYLRALCLAQTGESLKAAAHFQDVAERYPNSPLRDYALLAKAGTFFASNATKSAAEEYARVAEQATRPEVIAEAELLHGAAVCLSGEVESGMSLLQSTLKSHAGTGVAARAQYLLGEVRYHNGNYEQAIQEFNSVLTRYFEHELAASAQYRVGLCLDALGRNEEATGSYQAVVSGYPLTGEAPAAAYLAGVGLIDQNQPMAAVPYFQLVLDRYAKDDSTGVVILNPDHQEMVEAALCLLQFSYHRAGQLAALSGAPHLMLERMPPSDSEWRAYALLIDADAQAAQARYAEAQVALERLTQSYPDHPVAMHANRLLAWTYARQGEEDLAIQTEERMLARYATQGNTEHMSAAYLNKAHVLFNQKQYQAAAAGYEEFLNRFPGHDQQSMALYQAGLCYSRLDKSGDAVDRWETLVTLNPAGDIAERAWARAGDLYFQAEHYPDAERCYAGLLEHFSGSSAAALGLLRLAQCAYNAGDAAEALERFARVTDQFPGTPLAGEAERGMEQALYQLGQEDGGIETLVALIEQYPTSSFAADAQFEVAMRHYNGERFVEAADAFRRVVSQFPGSSSVDRAQFLMADAYAQAGQVEDARQGYEQFLLFFAESTLRPTVKFRLGSMRFAQGDYLRAAVDFTGVLEGDTPPEIASATLFNLALCQRLLGQTEEATASFLRYREVYPNDERTGDITYQLGDLHDQAGRVEEAARHFALALAQNPSAERATELHYRLGHCRERLDEVTSAIANYNNAIAAKSKADPFRLSALARCAALYEADGKYTLALKAYSDLSRHAEDPELVAAAKTRAEELKAVSK